MADKVEITDPDQFDKTLRGKSLAQLQAEVDFRLAVIAEKKREERMKEMEALVGKLNAAQDKAIEVLNLLNEHGLLADVVVQAYTTVGGSFAPHLKHRHVDADRLLSRTESSDKPKTRRPRKPKDS